MLRVIVLSLLATAIVPIASAECVGDTCVDVYTYGDGCSSGAEWDDAGRGLRIDSGEHHVYANNGCYVYNAEGYSEEGSHLAVGYYSCCESGFRTVAASWNGYTWNGNEECTYTVYSFGMDPLPPGALVDPIPCVNGPPGLILP
jgi:hypothetical protein